MLVAVLFLSVEAYAQGTIKGVVYDSDGKTPAVGVTVVVKGTNTVLRPMSTVPTP